MTKGQVATVSRQLLPSGPFASYKDLKRHWKNMVGVAAAGAEPPQCRATHCPELREKVTNVS